MVSTPLTIEHHILIDPVLYRAGFQDGCRSAMKGSLCQNESYLAGFHSGIKLYRSEIPAIAESHLERGFDSSLLNDL